MNKGRLSILAAILILIASFGIRNVLSKQKEDSQRSINAIIPKARVVPAEPKNIATQVPITGKLEALNSIELYAEVQGVLLVSPAPFLEGIQVGRGDVIVAIDPTETEANLVAQKSAFRSAVTNILSDIKLDFPDEYKVWIDYTTGIQLAKPLPPLPTTDNERLIRFLDSRNVRSNYFSVMATEERLSKYTLRAPFDGIISEALLKPGTLVRAGQKIGTFIQPNIYELEASIPVQDLPYVQVGAPVDLYSDDVPGQWKGSVSRINSQVDAASQTIHIYIRVVTSDLFAGTFLNGAIEGQVVENAVRVNRKLISNQSEVFKVENEKLTPLEVQVIRFEGEDALVLGIPEGTQLLSEVLPGAAAGMTVSPQTP